jgi:hypothetical protein
MEKYKLYLNEIIDIFFEKINTLMQEEENDFQKGQLFVYYDILTILKEQAKLFEITFEELGINEINENELLFNGKDNK